MSRGLVLPNLSTRLLEHAQELRLHLHRELTDLVEEHRAAVGRFEETCARAGRAGEGAFLVTEELALEQRLRNGRAVEAQERAALALRALVNRLGEHLLADAGFAQEEDRNVALRGARGERVEALHLRIGEDGRAEARRSERRRLHRLVTAQRLVPGRGRVALNQDQHRADSQHVSDCDRDRFTVLQLIVARDSGARLLGDRVPALFAQQGRTVRAAEIFDLDLRGADPQHHVVARDGRIVDANVVARAASDRHLSRVG